MKTYPPIEQLRILKVTAIIGALVLAAGLVFALVSGDQQQIVDRIWSNLLLMAFYLLSLGLGGTLFVALSYICGAGWHVAFRRVPEAMGRMLPMAGLLMLAVLGARTLVVMLQAPSPLFQRIYTYTPAHAGEAGSFWFKELWLQPSFWFARAIGYIVLWVALASLIAARSRRQDQSGGLGISQGNIRLSALFLAVYAVTFSLASMDWLMALEPLWFSTMWGVYNFAGMLQAALAVIIILGLLLRGTGGPLQGVFNDEHLHDLGKLLIGFSCFWMYIWFSQYMLIWYSNIPEETSYFVTRTHGSWGPVVVLSIILNWIVPFFALLPKPAKRSGSLMMRIAVVVLLGRWVDLYLMVFPSTMGESPVFGVFEVAGIACLLGAASLLVLRQFAKSSPVPRGDPYLDESLHYHAG